MNAPRIADASRQVSDEEDDNADAVSPDNPPRLPELTLHTKLERVASYRFTPNGAILLSGFQSPIPQSGLMAAVARIDNLAQTPSSSPKDGDLLCTTLTYADGSVGSSNVVGRVLTPMKDRVVLLTRVGEGATGMVYRAFDLFDLRLVAVKVIPVNDQNKRRQLVHEISSLYERLATRHRRTTSDQPHPRSARDETTRNPLRSRRPPAGKASYTKRYHSWTLDNAGTKALPPNAQDGSEHILGLIDVFVTKSTSTLSLVSEYMDGGSLQVCE